LKIGNLGCDFKYTDDIDGHRLGQHCFEYNTNEVEASNHENYDNKEMYMKK
jgi:hypothetical protein